MGRATRPERPGEAADEGPYTTDTDQPWSAGDIARTSRPVQAWSADRLPIPPGRLIGRTWELDTIRHLLLHDEGRLLTLWGPAGIGKTRLALAAAADPQVRAAFHDGVVFVDLVPVREPANVVGAIAEAFGLGDVPYPLLLEHLESPLADRKMLLVLDNLEHLVKFTPQLASLLVNCPSVKVLATSRCALRLRWEHAFPIAPLAVPHSTLPTDAATAETYSGIALFVERARATRPDFQLTDANASLVAELCARLDGLPLALELAAARTKGLPLLVLLKRLEDRLKLLQSGAPDLPARQQTLRRALTWSFDLLDEDQQALFARLSVFDGGCCPEAAEAVCSDPRLSSDALEGLAMLVHHSLLRLDEVTSTGQARYTMLATIRDYALEHLARSGEADDVRRRHAAFYLALAEDADSHLCGPQQVYWLERLDREHANLRAALRWTIESGAIESGLRLAAALCRFWSIRGHLTEGRSWLRQLLHVPHAAQPGQPHANALRGLGVLAMHADDPLTARAHLEESLAICHAIDFSKGTGRVLQDLGELCLDQADLAAARQFFEQSLAIQRELADVRGIAQAHLGLGRVALAEGDVVQARWLLEDALGRFRESGDQPSIASVLEVFACLAEPHAESPRALTPALAITCPESAVVNGCVEEFTRREREVIELAVRGWSNRQIATELVISERTAEGHIHNILGKLQLASRAQLVAWGARLGLVVTRGPTRLPAMARRFAGERG